MTMITIYPSPVKRSNQNCLSCFISLSVIILKSSARFSTRASFVANLGLVAIDGSSSTFSARVLNYRGYYFPLATVVQSQLHGSTRSRSTADWVVLFGEIREIENQTMSMSIKGTSWKEEKRLDAYLSVIPCTNH